MEKELSALSIAIRKVRKQRGINQEQLGVLIGVKKSQVCKIEQMPQDMKLSTIMRIVKALDMEVILSSDGVTVKSVM